MEHSSQHLPTPNSSLRCLSHFSNDSSRSRFQNVQRIPSPPTSTSLHHIPDLQADIKNILEHVVASHDEQKKLSKEVDQLTTNVKTLERVLCGDVGRTRKRNKNPNSDTINKGGIVNRLVDMEASIDELLGLVTGLRAAPCVFLSCSFYVALFPLTFACPNRPSRAPR